MKENDKKNGVYLGTLDRFGYELSCVGKTKKQVVDAIMKNYEEAYKRSNDGLDPRKAHSYVAGSSDYAVAKNDIGVEWMEIGVVEWR